MYTESLTTDFFDLCFWCKGILNGFASVSACGCLGSDCRVICYYLVHIYCPKESKCHALARFVLFVRLVFEKHIRVWIIFSWPRISRIPRIYTMSQPTRFVQFVRLVFEKHIRVCIIFSWPRISRIKRIYTMSQPKKIRQIRPISVRKTYSRMNYIQLTTNLPNPTNTYRVAT